MRPTRLGVALPNQKTLITKNEDSLKTSVGVSGEGNFACFAVQIGQTFTVDRLETNANTNA